MFDVATGIETVSLCDRWLLCYCLYAVRICDFNITLNTDFKSVLLCSVLYTSPYVCVLWWVFIFSVAASQWHPDSKLIQPKFYPFMPATFRCASLCCVFEWVLLDWLRVFRDFSPYLMCDCESADFCVWIYLPAKRTSQSNQFVCEGIQREVSQFFSSKRSCNLYRKLNAQNMETSDQIKSNHQDGEGNTSTTESGRTDTKDTESKQSKKWLLFLCYCIGAVIYGCLETAIASLFSDITEQLGVDEMETSYIVLAKAFSYIVATVAAAFVMDKFRESHRFYGFVLIICGGAVAAIPFTTDYLLQMGCWSMTGFAHGTLDTALPGKSVLFLQISSHLIADQQRM